MMLCTDKRCYFNLVFNLVALQEGSALQEIQTNMKALHLQGEVFVVLHVANSASWLLPVSRKAKKINEECC